MGLINFSMSDIGDLLRAGREMITGEGIKDPQKILDFELKAKQIEQAISLGQVEINKIEAEHPSRFVAGWRPAIGWVAAISLALMYIPKAIVLTILWTYQSIEVVNMAQDISNLQLPIFPELGTMEVIGLVSSMLGIGVMRSYDKREGTDTKRITK